MEDSKFPHVHILFNVVPIGSVHTIMTRLSSVFISDFKQTHIWLHLMSSFSPTGLLVQQPIPILAAYLKLITLYLPPCYTEGGGCLAENDLWFFCRAVVCIRFITTCVFRDLLLMVCLLFVLMALALRTLHNV